MVLFWLYFLILQIQEETEFVNTIKFGMNIAFSKKAW